MQPFIADHKHKDLWARKGLFSTALIHDLGYCAARMLCTRLGSPPLREKNQSLSGISVLPVTLVSLTLHLEETGKKVFILFLLFPTLG